MYKKIFWSFKSYVNDEVATQNNLGIFGKLFVKKLAIIVNEMNRITVARKNNEPVANAAPAA